MGNLAVSDVFAVGMLGLAAFCTVRLGCTLRWGRAGGRPAVRAQREIEVVLAVMAVSMAGMLSPRLATVSARGWLVVFAVITLWFGWRVTQDAERAEPVEGGAVRHLPHLLMSAAMVYMLVAATWTVGMGSPRGGSMAMGAALGRWPVATTAVALLLVFDGIFTFAREVRVASVASAAFAAVPVGAPDGRADTTLAGEAAPTPCSGRRVRAALGAPMPVLACQLVMSLVMGYMLLSAL